MILKTHSKSLANQGDRLDTQNEIWTREDTRIAFKACLTNSGPCRNLGYHVHPMIASRLNASSRIADLGTGTGIFLLELSQQLPSTCQLNGFDISDEMYPPSAVLPANVSLAVHDARCAFPASLMQTYDLVHIKLMVTGLEKDDWEVVTANALQLLKPGGAVQWAEADFLHAVFLRNGMQGTSPALQHVGRRFHEGIGHRLQFGYSTLPVVLEQQGFHDVFQQVVASDRLPETREALTRVSYDGIFGWAHQLRIKKIAGTWTLDEIEELEARTNEEIVLGSYSRYDIYVTIGFAKVSA